jgi:uncharacterized membrane protein YkvA (DUF1232 family)
MALSLIDQLKGYARHLKSETYALLFAAKDLRTPWYAKLVLALVVAYAFSPIDLIPDFIPIIGYLDDLILLPLGIVFAIKLVPEVVMAECRIKAQQSINNAKPSSWLATAIIILIWLLLALLSYNWLLTMSS